MDFSTNRTGNFRCWLHFETKKIAFWDANISRKEQYKPNWTALSIWPFVYVRGLCRINISEYSVQIGQCMQMNLGFRGCHKWNHWFFVIKIALTNSLWTLRLLSKPIRLHTTTISIPFQANLWLNFILRVKLWHPIEIAWFKQKRVYV